MRYNLFVSAMDSDSFTFGRFFGGFAYRTQNRNAVRT